MDLPTDLHLESLHMRWGFLPLPAHPPTLVIKTQYRAHQPEMIKTGHAFLKGDFRDAKCNI